MWTRISLLPAIVLALGSPGLIAQTPGLPEIPQVNIAKFPPETQEQVQQAYDASRGHPHDASAAGKLGMLLDLYHRPEAAILCYQRAHKLNPRSFKWLYYWGSLLLNRKKRDEAVPVLISGLQLRPDYLPAELKLAEALLESGRTQEAGRTYEAILKQYPDSAEARYGLGRVHAANGDLAGAVERYGTACELFPTYGAAHYALALTYRKLGQSDKAQEHLRIYERNKNIVPPVDDPLRDDMRELDSSATSYVERGVALEQVGRIQDAIKATEKAVELDPERVLAHANLLSLYGRVGNLQKAEEQYRAVMALNPDQFPKAHYDYGVLLMTKGEYKEAEEAFRRAIRINPSYAQAHNNLGHLLERGGKLPEAMAEYRKSMESMPGYRQAHFNLGRILVNQGNYQEGIEQLSKTLTPVDESTPAYLYALGAAYGRAGDRQNALRYLHQAREQASARGQAKLLADIEEDLRTLEGRTDTQ
jgi:tetratricopeptide (TPR) repeat protein